MVVHRVWASRAVALGAKRRRLASFSQAILVKWWIDIRQFLIVIFSFDFLVVYQFGMCREWVDVEPQSHIDGGIMPGRPSLRGDLGGLPESMMMVGTGKSLSSVNGSRNGISAGRCKSCERKQSCSSCLVDLGCGWCYYSNNPMIGVCKPGDFHSPAAGKMGKKILCISCFHYFNSINTL